MFSILNISLGVAFVSIIYRYLIYPSFLSPLSKIPIAHFTSSWSPLWILWIRYTDEEVQTIHKAHLKYGPIVRLGPEEVSVNCVDGGLRTIYAGGFEKPYFYDQFRNYGVENMFSMKENKSHAARKRMLSNVFSKSFLQSSKDALEMTRLIVFDRLLPTLDSSAVKDSPVEVYELNYGTTMDFVSSYLFGVSNDANFILDVEMRKRFLGWYWGRPDHSFWIQELPRLTQIFRSIGINLVPKWVHAANAEIEAWLLGKCQAAEQTINAASEYSEKAHGTHPIVYGQLRDSVKKSRTESGSGEKTDCSVQEETLIASELLDHVGAGMDTSGITLTYIYWEMSRNPELQDRLRKELLTLSPTLEMRNRSTLPSARSVDALPLLHAIVMETLRRHGAIPGSQPRITPSTPTSVAGSPPLPGGVRISAQAYSLHRNEQVFPEPEAWRPERWLDADPSQKEKMMRWFWAFGSGPRMCVGSNLAMHEIKYVTAAVYSNFSTSIVDDSGMDQVDSYTAGPEGEELILKFSRIQ